jgi:hypothetical protein
MRINYNVTGAQRKELVRVIADTTGARPSLHEDADLQL